MSWPTEWLRYYNSCQDPCDNPNGPCICGAWHDPKEFSYRPDATQIDGDGWLWQGILYRFGKPVAGSSKLGRVAGW